MTSLTANFRFVIIATNKSAQVSRSRFVLKPELNILQSFRPSSSSSSANKAKTLSRSLSLVTTSKENLFDPNKRPIVLLYSWLLAKKRYIRHYSQIYTDKGFDILQVRVLARDVLWPKSVRKTVLDIGDFLTSTPGRPVVVHGFSVGGFVHSEVLHHLLNSADRSKSEEVFRRMKGQIFDSVVDVIGVPEGVSAALFLNQPILRKVAEASIEGYLKLLGADAMSVYRRASGIFHSNPLLTPSLMLYSNCDPIGSSGPIESAIKTWQEKGVPVMSRCWDDTPHVGHFRAHRDEYLAYVDRFLESIGLGDRTDVGSRDPKCIPSDGVPTDIPVPITVTAVPDKAIDTPIIKSKQSDVSKRKIFASNKPAM